VKELLKRILGLRFSIGLKFVAIIAVILSITMGSAAIVNYRSHNQLFLQHLEHKGEMLGQFIASISPKAILSNNILALIEYVRQVSHQQDIVYAMILAKQGHPLTSYLNNDNPYIKSAIKKVNNRRLLPIIDEINKNRDIISMRFPIRFNDRRYGTVLIGLSRARIEELSRQELIKQLLGSLFIIVFLCASIFIAFRYSALRSILRLYKGYQRVAEGNLDHRIKTRNNDELGDLAHAFNDMVEKLKISTHEKDMALNDLQELNKHLESRVEVRTHALERLNKELEQLALHDSLTGLPNRSLIQDRMKQAISNAHRAGYTLAIIMMDLDRFKEINDTLGHNVGDCLLQDVGSRLRATLRNVDTVGRLGGDEFAILVPDTDSAASVTIAKKLIQALEPPFLLEGLNFSIGASFGIALYPEHGFDASMLLKRADVAMYIAKQNKCGYFIYDTDKDTHSTSRLALMGDLRSALDEDALTLNFQPIVSVQDSTVIGIEALCRWPHPEKGLIPPNEFIPMMEQTALVRPFAEWVLKNALKQWKSWQRNGTDVLLFVNLSMRNLHDSEFPEQVSRVFDSVGLDKANLILEITESVIMADPQQVLRVLPDLQKFGIDFAIDDFGTGYSSLSQLRHLPVRAVKIDRSFVINMDSNKDDATIVRSTIDLAHNLGLKVIAEGVENQATIDMLHDLNCDMIQGNFICQPIGANEISVFLQQRHTSADINTA
jgi:diguanylate cyclase (GGDEF)-like protein